MDGLQQFVFGGSNTTTTSSSTTTTTTATTANTTASWTLTANVNNPYLGYMAGDRVRRTGSALPQTPFLTPTRMSDRDVECSPLSLGPPLSRGPSVSPCPSPRPRGSTNTSTSTANNNNTSRHRTGSVSGAGVGVSTGACPAAIAGSGSGVAVRRSTRTRRPTLRLRESDAAIGALPRGKGHRPSPAYKVTKPTRRVRCAPRRPSPSPSPNLGPSIKHQEDDDDNDADNNDNDIGGPLAEARQHREPSIPVKQEEANTNTNNADDDDDDDNYNGGWHPHINLDERSQCAACSAPWPPPGMIYRNSRVMRVQKQRVQTVRITLGNKLVRVVKRRFYGPWTIDRAHSSPIYWMGLFSDDEG